VFFPDKTGIMKTIEETFAYDVAIPLSRRQEGTSIWVFQT